ncbi:MAG: hypothetical protein ACOYL3_01765 [Desulfuromonadaceae bacterium]
MATYEICGTCSFYHDNGITKTRIHPAEGYLSPDKRRAICYPLDQHTSNARLHKLCNGYCNFSAPNHEHIVASAAATQKKIQLFVNERMDVSGVTFPAP